MSSKEFLKSVIYGTYSQIALSHTYYAESTGAISYLVTLIVFHFMDTFVPKLRTRPRMPSGTAPRSEA